MSRVLAPAHIVAVASPSYMKGRTPPAEPSGLAAFDGIVMRSSSTRRVRERLMRNAAGDEMRVPLKPTVAFDDPEAMCQAAVLGLGVTQIVMAHALRHLESGALMRLVPQWYADAGPISIYYASRRQVPAKTRVFVDFIAEAFRRLRLAERFAGSIGYVSDVRFGSKAEVKQLQDVMSALPQKATCAMRIYRTSAMGQ